MPVSQLDEQVLTYPLGVGDFSLVFGKSFDQKSFSTIPMLFMQGSSDDNDSIPEGIEMQSRANFSSDSYSFEQAKWANEYFGTLPIDRLPLVREIYRSIEPTDFAYKSILNEKHSAKNLKPLALAFFDCVQNKKNNCAEKVKTKIDKK